MDENVIGIKVFSGEVPAGALMLVKKLVGVAPSEAKRRISEGEYLFSCDYVEEGGISKINRLRRGLDLLGVGSKLYEDGEESTPELFENIERQFREIEEEVEAYPD